MNKLKKVILDNSWKNERDANGQTKNQTFPNKSQPIKR